jgi:hypothetical protein
MDFELVLRRPIETAALIGNRPLVVIPENGYIVVDSALEAGSE